MRFTEISEGSPEDRFKKYIRPVTKTTPKIERTTNPSGRTTDHVEWLVTSDTGEKRRFTSKKEAQEYYDLCTKQSVAEGSEIKIPTEDGITMQDIRLMAGDGPLTKKTILQAIAVIRKQRRPQGVAEGESTTQKYEMMMRNGRVKKFIAKDDADAKRIAAGHGAKSVIRLRGGVPAGKVLEQGVTEGSDASDNLVSTLNSFGYYSDNSSVYANADGDKIARQGSNWKHQSGQRGTGAEELSDFLSSQEVDEGENWSKHNNKRAGGMSKKSVASYRRSHPGSKIQTAVTTKPSKLKKGSKSAKRRASFCARMRGMKKHRTGAKTARDPNSNINKSLRRWHCESIEELQELVMLAEQFIRNNKK